MKSERKQELKTNDLAFMLTQGREWLRAWGSYLAAAVVVIVMIVAFRSYRTTAAEQEIVGAWDKLEEVVSTSFFTQSQQKRTDLEIDGGFEELQKIADTAKDEGLIFDALQTQASVALSLGTMDGVIDPAYLDKAEKAYDALKSRLPNNPLAVAVAMNGAIAVESSRFVLDGDQSRKDKVRKVLQSMRDDSRFANTPYQTSAMERLNRLDDVFRQVVLAPAPEVPDAAVGPMQPINLTGSASGGVQVKRVESPSLAAPPAAPKTEPPVEEDTTPVDGGSDGEAPVTE